MDNDKLDEKIERNNDRIEKGIINKKVFPEYFLEEGSFDSEILDWLKYNPEQG